MSFIIIIIILLLSLQKHRARRPSSSSSCSKISSSKRGIFPKSPRLKHKRIWKKGTTNGVECRSYFASLSEGNGGGGGPFFFKEMNAGARVRFVFVWAKLLLSRIRYRTET